MKFGECPNCEKKIDVGPMPKIGTEIRCKNCGHDSVIVWLNPIELDSIDPTDYLFEDYYEDNIYK